MKKMMFFCLFFVVQTLGAKEFLSQEQKNEVLIAIDQICADSWCEGDHDFSFKKLNCDDKTHSCELTLKYWDYGSHFFKHSKTCELKNIEVFDNLFATDGTNDLSDPVYDQINECLSNIE